MHAAAVLMFAMTVACGGGGGRGSGDGGTGDGGMDATPGDGDTGDDGSTTDGGGGGDGGCPVRCGPSFTCCAAGEECVVDRCLPACEGSRCGADDSLCCGGEELCVGGECVMPGDPCDDETDCGEDETCEPLVRRCVPIPEGAECRFVPPSGMFEPEVQWHWDAEQSQSIPLVVQLTDDDGDGAIDGRDIPDIVALTYASNPFDARITALSGDDGSLLWQSPDANPVCGSSSAAAGDLDGDGTVEIVTILSDSGACGSGAGDQRVAAFDHTGALEWESDTGVATRYGAVAIADLEGDGDAEIVAGGSVFDSDGSFLWSAPELNDILGTLAANAPSVADVDGDSRMEIIASDVVFNDDGTELWRGSSVSDGYTAVAHIVDDMAGPQVVAVNQTTMQVLDGATGTSLLGPVSYETSGILAGPPTVADFDGDDNPEIGVAGDARYVVFDPDMGSSPYIRWSIPSMDSSTGSVGSTVFDFDADGSAEVVYSDECHLRIVDGDDGTVLWYASNTSITALEYPVVADVDADGNGELVVVSNSSTISCSGRSLPFDEAVQGVRIFRDVLDNWVPTRSVWNQHTYHIDNVGSDGAIPAGEVASWDTHNTYRLNRLLDSDEVTLAPNLVVVATDADVGVCPVRVTLRARIENRGSRGVPAGVKVAFFQGDPPARDTLLAVGETTRTLLGGAAEWVEAEARDVTLDDMMRLRFYAVVDDDGMGTGEHSECDEDDNVGEPVEVECSGPG